MSYVGDTRWTRAAGSGLALPTGTDFGKKAFAREAERLGRPKYQEPVKCDFPTEIMMLTRTRKDGTHYCIPVPVERCGLKATSTYCQHGQTMRRCTKHPYKADPEWNGK